MAICLLAGTALQALLRPRGRWLTLWSLPLGACLLVCLLYPLGYLTSTGRAGPLAVGLTGALLLAMAVVRVRLRREGRPGGLASLGEALSPPRADLLVMAVALGGGLLVLIPLFQLGFPSVLGITNNDGWYYAGLVNWLSDNAAGAAIVAGVTQPLDGAAVMMRQSSLPFGFELIAATVRSLLGREAFEAVGPTAAVGVPVAVCGWAALRQAVTERAGAIELAVTAVAATATAFLLPYSESYLTQFMGLALMPIVAASAVALARRPGLPELVAAGVAGGGILGVYVGLLPWAALMVAVVPFVVAGPWPAWAKRLRPRRRERVARGLVLLAGLVVAILVLAPIMVWRGLEFTRLASGLEGAGIFPSLDAETQLALLTGAGHLPTEALGGRDWIGMIAVGAALLIALAVSVRRPGGRVMLALGAAAAAATAIVLVRYHQSGFNYGVYKTVLSGGAVIGGCLVVALAIRRPGWRAVSVQALALALCAVVWVSGATSLLRAVDNSQPGFRDPEIALGDQLRALPAGSVVLVEGSDIGGSGYEMFQLRMMTAYWITTIPGLRAEGLWSSPTYLSPGPLPQFRPELAWSHVLISRFGPLGTGREVVWERPPWLLYRAPTVDVTDFGLSWQRPLLDERGRIYQAVTGPAELVVSNRGPRPRLVRLSLTLESGGPVRSVVLRPAGGPAREVSLPARGARRTVVEVRVAAGRTAAVALEPGPAPPQPPGTGLVRIRAASALPPLQQPPEARGRSANILPRA